MYLKKYKLDADEFKNNGLCKHCIYYNPEKEVSCERYNMITENDKSCKSWEEKDDQSNSSV